MSIGRLLVAIVIGIVIALGAYVFWQLQSRSGDGDQPPGEQAPQPGQQPLDPNQRTVNIGGIDIVLNPDPNQTARLAREVPQNIQGQNDQQTVEPTATPEPIVVPADPQPTPADQVAAATATPLPAVSSGGDRIVTVAHVVGAGETLYSIARRYQTSVALMAEYGIAQDHLVVGNTLNVPVPAPSACTTGRAHVVLEGDNVFRIAIRYNTTKEQIRALNGLGEDYLIKAGNVLCIP